MMYGYHLTLGFCFIKTLLIPGGFPVVISTVPRFWQEIQMLFAFAIGRCC